MFTLKVFHPSSTFGGKYWHKILGNSFENIFFAFTFISYQLTIDIEELMNALFTTWWWYLEYSSRIFSAKRKINFRESLKHARLYLKRSDKLEITKLTKLFLLIAEVLYRLACRLALSVYFSLFLCLSMLCAANKRFIISSVSVLGWKGKCKHGLVVKLEIK